MHNNIPQEKTMSRSLNKVFLIGRLGQDVEMKSSQSGTTVAKFSLAISDKVKNTSGEYEEKTTWLNVVAFGKIADICGQYLKKGARVYVEGKIQVRTFEKDGETKYFTEIILNEMIMLDGKDTESEQPGKLTPAKKAASTRKEPKPFEATDDDVPF
jgi:single-strand DNA-binding protein